MVLGLTCTTLPALYCVISITHQVMNLFVTKTKEMLLSNTKLNFIENCRVTRKSKVKQQNFGEICDDSFDYSTMSGVLCCEFWIRYNG